VDVKHWLNTMKSIVEVEINAPQQKVAELHADPCNNPKWMRDVARYEPVSGEAGMPGSTYRLVPKEGGMIFSATVVERNLPSELKLRLETQGITIDVTARFNALSPEKTRLVSEQEFTFAGESAPVSADIEDAIRASHRAHIEDFKHFVESIHS
jgi:hypothetical protein